jgi:hypothetical protein
MQENPSESGSGALSADQRRSLRCLAEMIIPASAEYGVPSAGDAAIFADILRSLGRCWRRCGSVFFCRCFAVARMLGGQQPVSSVIFHEGVGLLARR